MNAYAGTVPSYFVRHSDGLIRARAHGWHVTLGTGSMRMGPVELEVIGADRTSIPGGTPAGKVNYFAGDREHWQTGLTTYSTVSYPRLLPGIDVRFAFHGSTLKSEYVVAPYADPASIRFRYSGALATRIENGSLLVATEEGEFKEPPPIVYQDSPGEGRHSISARYTLAADGVAGFELGSYDPSLPLIIDPYILVPGTLLGGSGADHVSAMGSDSSGNLYLAGWTESANINTVGGLGIAPGGVDAFVAKLNPEGTQVLYATYYGGSGFDQALALAVEPGGSVWIAGHTQSADLPRVAAMQNALGGGRDAFVAHIRADGAALLVSTFLGGNGSDTAKGIALTPSGDVWVAGETESSNFPLASAYQGTLKGIKDAFVTRLSASGALVSSTYFGGAGNDFANAVVVDSSGNVYLTGATESADFPQANAARARGGAQDAFVTKLNTTATALIYSTYLGGSAGSSGNAEYGTAITVDGAGNAVVTGLTSSTDFPLVTPVQSTFAGGVTDTFIARLSSTGALTASTYFGGSSTDEGLGLALGPSGQVWICGLTASSDIPDVDATDASQPGDYDAFVARLAADLSSIAFSTHLAGTKSDQALAIVARGTSVYVAGSTESTDLIPGSFQGIRDLFVIKLAEAPVSVTLASSPAGASVNVAGSGCQVGSYITPAVLSWVAGTACTITIEYLRYPSPGLRLAFAGWADGPTTVSRIIAPTSNGTWSALFSSQYQLTTAISPVGAGALYVAPPSVDGYYNAGTSVQVSASPASGYRFGNWTGSAAGSPNPTALSMNTVHSATATFTCEYALSGVVQSIGPATTAINVQVTTGSTCTWNATSNVGWISVSQSGNNATYTVQANTGGVRTGTVTIAGQIFTITQASGACLATLSTPSSSFETTGGSGSVSISTAAHCSWLASTATPWLTILTPSGTGTSVITYSVAPNTGPLRTGTIAANGAILTVTQAGSESNINPSIEALEPFAGSGVTQVFTLSYSDTNGWADITKAIVAFGSQPGPNAGCYAEIFAAGNEASLYNDAGNARLGPVTLGSSGIVENSYCRINASDSSFTGAGMNLTVRVSITFKPPFYGEKRSIFLNAYDKAGRTSEWYCLGAWWPGNVLGSPVNRYRVFNPLTSSHVHTTDYNEYTTLGSWGFGLEGVTSRLYNAPAVVAGTQLTPLYRIYNVLGSRHFWTSSRLEYTTLIRFRGTYSGEGIDGFVLQGPGGGAIPMYRLVHMFANPLIHHWTQSEYEYQVLGATGLWRAEGVAAWVFPVN